MWGTGAWVRAEINKGSRVGLLDRLRRLAGITAE